MKITIIIPTVSFGRFSLLFKMIKSIHRGLYKDFCIVIVIDGNRKLYETIGAKVEKLYSRSVSVILNKERRGWVFSTNRVLKEFNSPYYIYASDDLIFPSDCIENAMITMKERFPDGYGVVSLGRKVKAIFGLFGNKWVEHFPKREVFCPYYIHYSADREHTEFMKKIGKFAYSPKRDSQVKHFRLKVETCIISRSSRSRDLILRSERKKNNRLWGINFDR